MRKITSIFCSVCVASVLFSCATTNVPSGSSDKASRESKNKNAPSWIAEPYGSYDGKLFFVSVGEGNSKTDAEVHAVEGIASVFEQSVDSKTTSSKRMSQAEEKGVISYTTENSLGQDIMRRVKVDALVGIEINEYFQESGSKFYALAVLDKTKTSNLYAQMIEKNNEAIEKYLNASRGIYTLESYSNADFAYDISILNEKLLKRLSVIDFDRSVEMEKKCVKSPDINKVRVGIAGQIPIYVEFEGDSDGKIASSYGAMVSSLGFRTSSQKSERYAINGKFSYTTKETKDKSSFQCNYTVQLSLSDTGLVQKMYETTYSGRASSVSVDDAVIRAYKGIGQKASGDGKKEFVEFLQGLASF